MDIHAKLATTRERVIGELETLSKTIALDAPPAVIQGILGQLISATSELYAARSFLSEAPGTLQMIGA